MEFPKTLQYAKTHEWVKKDGDTVLIGLTDYAQDQLGDIVFVNLPEAGDEVAMGESFADVESVKAVSDIYSPVTGVVEEVNFPLPKKKGRACSPRWAQRLSTISTNPYRGKSI